MNRLDTTNRLMAVIDDAAIASAAAAALRAAGLSDVTCLVGAAGIERLDRSGRRGGPRVRLARLLSYLTADQSVDLATYEAALRDGRGVLAIHVASTGGRARAVRMLRDAAAHFVNFYGPMTTEVIVDWRGELLPVPYRFHR